jgi:hypothetical protein
MKTKRKPKKTQRSIVALEQAALDDIEQLRADTKEAAKRHTQTYMEKETGVSQSLISSFIDSSGPRGISYRNGLKLKTWLQGRKDSHASSIAKSRRADRRR